MASTSTTRYWRVLKEANRPWPTLCDDSVIDYMIMEAVALKVQEEDKRAAEEQKKKEWKKDTSNLDKFR